MTGKKVLSVFIVALFIASSAVITLTAIPDTSDAAETYTAEYYPSHTVYKIEYETGNYGTMGIPADDKTLVEECDKIAYDYANGVTNKFNELISAKQKSIGPNTKYYGYQTNTYSSQGITRQIFECEKRTTYVPLNPGTYNICVRSATHNGVDVSDTLKMYLCYSEYGSYYTNRNLSINTDYEFTVYSISSFYISPSNQDYEVTFTYELTPSPITDKHEATESHTLMTQYAWYVGRMTLTSGTYTHIGQNYSNSICIVISNPEKQALFESEIVQQNKVYTYTPGDDNRYDVIYASNSNPVTLTSLTTVKIYQLNNGRPSDVIIWKQTSSGTQYEYKKIDFTKLTSDGTKSYTFYASANKTFDLTVDYDADSYCVYLVYSSDQMTNSRSLLIPGALYHIDNGQARTYEIVAEINTNSSYSSMFSTIDSLDVDVCIYTDGLPTSDSNVFIFAIICIAICVVAFGLLIRSGKKPSWSKDKTQK